MARLVTFATMVQTDGTRTIYGVYQGQLCERKGQPHHIDLNARSTRFVANVEVSPATRPALGRVTYLSIAEKYQTPAYPAFSWGGVGCV